MFRIVFASLAALFSFVSRPALAQTPLDQGAMTLYPVQGLNLPLYKVIQGNAQWLRQNVEACKDVRVLAVDENPDLSPPGCYVVYGPDDKEIGPWSVRSLIVEERGRRGFTFAFMYDGKGFSFGSASSENKLDFGRDQLKVMYQEFVMMGRGLAVSRGGL